MLLCDKYGHGKVVIEDYLEGPEFSFMALVNGENVYPTDIEFLVNRLPYVQESILFPRENSKKEISLGIKAVYDSEIIKESFGEKTEEQE